ncbi:MAG: RsmB/NOP family class I SAM-dependent RNA methyltransferase [Bacteroidetes bacterium]|nr:RsmB/NOP family class I SAM-dependent RNA methyltransferase [Bacteroidota bacterium]
MRIYKNLTDAVVSILQKIREENRYADKAIEYILKENPKWGARDRRFVAETTYDMVRQYRLLNELSENSDNRYRMLGVYFLLKGYELPAWSEFAEVDKKHIQQKIQDLQNKRAVFQSIPDWLDDLGYAELEHRWNKELEALNTPASVVLRANTLKISTKQLQQQLLQAGIETHLLQYDALLLKERKNVFASPLFKQGLFEIQDASSQQVAPFLKPNKNQFIIDACAGAGGKALHIAALTQNKSKVLALDVEEKKLTELHRRAVRAGAKIESRLIASNTVKQLNQTADRLLLDVPCSGLGVLKRNPDAKWKLSLERIEDLKKIQQHILQEYSGMLKVGGLMVYATCSILPGENQKQVQHFLEKNTNFSYLEDKAIYPSQGFDGFYMCLMQRNG